MMLVFVFSGWTLTKNNFFVFDDYHNLVSLPYLKFTDMMHILPNYAYCSRPVGWIIVKILLNLFGLNYKYHVITILCIHGINGILTYFLVLNFFKEEKYKRVFAFISALIFSIYPISNMPSYWESAIFDLFGTTLMLICFNIFFVIENINIKDKKCSKKKICLSIVLFLLYYISLRTKEMFIALPVLLIIYSLFNDFFKDKGIVNLKNNFKEFNFKKFIKKNIYLLFIILVMFAYFIYSCVLNKTNEYTTNVQGNYYYTFNLKVIITNIYNYICMYFNPISLLYGDVLTLISFGKLYKIVVLLAIIVISFLSIYKFLNGEYIYLFAIIGYIAIIMPVLPMPNLHGIWYLYAPAIFISLIIVAVLNDLLNLILKFIKKDKVKIIIISLMIVICVVFLAYANNLGNIKAFRNWWIEFAKNYKITYEYFTNLKQEYKDTKKIYVLNVPDGYTTLYIEDGGIIKVAFDDPNLKIFLNDNNYNNENNDEILVVDFNDYDFKLLNK